MTERTLVEKRSGLDVPRLGQLNPRSVLLMITVLSLFLSTRSEFRVGVGALKVPPFVLPVTLLAARLGPIHVVRQRRDLVRAITVLCVVFASAVLSRGLAFELVFKVMTFGATILVVAAATKTRRDFELGTLAFVGAIAAVSLAAIIGYTPSLAGVNPLQGVGNKNSFSLYALPALLVGVFAILDQRLRRAERLLLIVGCSVITLTIFATANRAGWLGAVAIPGLLIATRRNPKDVVYVFLIGLAVVVSLHRFGYMETIKHRIEQSQAGSASDTRRLLLIDACWSIGIHNPLLGVGPQELSAELGRHLGRAPVDAHNLPGYVWAGGGVPLTAALGAVLVCLWRGGDRLRTGLRRNVTLVHAIVLLFLLRGWYTSEVLFSPAFAMGMGLAVGHAQRGLGPGATSQDPIVV